MKKLALFSLALTACLPLASVRPAAAATTQETVVAQASGDTQPYALAWFDDTQGNTKTDDTMGQKVAATFAGVHYLITDGGHLLIMPGSGNSQQPILPPADAAEVDNGKGVYIVHLRSGSTFLNGLVYRFSDDPTKGFAKLNLVLINQQGASEAIHIEQSLTWKSNQPSGGTGNPPPANPLGFARVR